MCKSFPLKNLIRMICETFPLKKSIIWYVATYGSTQFKLYTQVWVLVYACMFITCKTSKIWHAHALLHVLLVYTFLREYTQLMRNAHHDFILDLLHYICGAYVE